MQLPRVYSLGNSTLIPALSHDIACLPNQPKIPNIVMLLQDSTMLNKFTSQNSKWSFIGVKENSLQFMASASPPKLSTGELASINNLIIGENSDKMFSNSLNKYKNCLHPNSSILFLNPRFGLVEYVKKKIWPNKDDIPNIFIGSFEEPHSLLRQKGFKLNVKAHSMPLKITRVPKSLSQFQYDVESINEWSTENPLMNLLSKVGQNTTDYSLFKPHFYNYGDLAVMHYENLMFDSCIEPLAAVLDCQTYGELLQSSFYEQLMTMLLQEQIVVLNLAYPYLRKVPHFETVFQNDRMKSAIYNHITGKRHKKPEMVQMLKSLNKTNISQLNGFFVSLAKYRKYSVPYNEMVLNLVRAKTEVSKNKALSYFYL